jgi:hypothetical protein
MPAQTSVTTQIPVGTNHASVVGSLHNHDLYIKITSHDLVEYKKVSGDSTEVGSPSIYEVVDNRPVGKTTVKMTLVNQTNGIDVRSEVEQPTRVNVDFKWRVVGDKLEEAVVIDTNMLIRNKIKSGIEKNSPENHLRFIEASQ